MKEAKLTRRSFIAGTAATGALAALALSGCSSTETAPEEQGSAEGTVQSTAGTTLTGTCAYSSTNYNPVGNSSALMYAATLHVFEGLYGIDLASYTIYNQLAEGEPVKVDETTYTVALRADAKFSDGTAVVADDVVNAFNLNMQDATYGAFLEFIESVEAADESTVQFNLHYPFESLLKGRLAVVKVFPASICSDYDTMSETALATMPIGSGPWAYESINGDDLGQIAFVPNAYYNGSEPAQAENMTWYIQKGDESARTTSLVEGTVMVMEDVPAANEETITGAGATAEYVQGFAQAFLMFNCQKAPFNDYRVRQAFFYAIDIEKLIANQMSGHAAAITSFLPETYSNYHQASTVYTYDPEKAMALLEEAGASGLSFELLCNNNWVQSLSAQIQQDLQAVGMNVTLNVSEIDWAPLAPSESDEILGYDVMLTPGDPSCFGNDPDLLLSWWYGDNVWTQGRSCWQKDGTGDWETLSKIMQQAREESDTTNQQELWNQCFDLVAEKVPLYALVHRQIGTAYWADKINDFSPIGTTGLIFLGSSPA